VMSQAQARYLLVFDGGSRGNPGPGYGNYLIVKGGQRRWRKHVEFEGLVTNNEAEYDALIAALEDLLGFLEASQCPPEGVALEIWGDSMLVINQVQGRWKARDERMRARKARVRELLNRFASWRMKLQPRGRINELLRC